MAHIPAGTIAMWFGSIASIPNNFVLCDGNNGTPDLRDKFIVGAGDTYAVDAVGGAIEHAHSFISNNHSHALDVAGSGISAGGGLRDVTDLSTVSGNTDNANSLPPYHSLVYMMHI